MKKLLPFLSLIFLASCGGKDNAENAGSVNILENLTYTVDTVVVDPGEEMFNLRETWLGPFYVSPDQKKLFRYDYSQRLFNKVDLDGLRLLTNYKFEPEGPNGINYVASFQFFGDEYVFLPDSRNPGIFNYEGELVESFDLKPESIKGLEKLDQITQMGGEIIWDYTNKKLITVQNGPFQDSIRLVMVEPEISTGKTLKIPEMEFAKKFDILWLGENSGSISGEYFSMSKIKEKIYISTTASSSIYIFDPKTEDLTYVPIEHRTLPNKKTGEVKNEVKEEKEFREELRKTLGQISYQKLFWDEPSKRFYRLATKTILGENKDDPSSTEVYLLLYDENLKPIGEALFEKNEIRSYFFKDGKLYSYVNVEDELGFAVFTFDF